MSQVSNLQLTDKTPLPVADKIKFMNHVNDEHQDELAMFIEAFTDARLNDKSTVLVAEVYTDGLLLETSTQHSETLPSHTTENLSDATSQYFIEFEQEIDAATTVKSQYISLLQVASKKLGKLAIKPQERHFSVIEGYYASPSMFRLVVTAPADTPLDHPGYAYLFDVNTELSTSNGEATSHAGKLQRYYTLRKAWQDSDSQQVYGWIDTYIHGDTPGGNWAREVKAGMALKSVRDYPEKIAHLKEGQCLLICDETSISTVANLLENWQNPIAPIVIAITNDSADIAYLQDIDLDDKLAQIEGFKQDNILHILNTPPINLPEAITSIVDAQLQLKSVSIDKVWGAIEASDAKTLRRQLKTKFNLPRQDMIMKVYWRAS